MIRIHRRISKAVTVFTLAALLLTGCTSEASNIGNAMGKDEKIDVVDTGFTLTTVGSYDSADTAVVLSVDLKNKAVTLVNMDTGKQYTLYYDGTTYVKNKHDGSMTISQIEAGDVVDVTFLKGKKKLASIKLSPEAWVLEDLYNYDLTGSNRTASIGSQTYSLPDGVVVLSEGRRVETGEVVSQDVVTISGINHKIYSVNVNKGHGYLRLKNDQPLLGGWIEVGNRVIRRITEDMLLVVPEGSYQVVLSNNNVGCIKNVTIERDKEVVLDVSDLEVAEDAVGKILFTVTPETAKVSIDGKPVDISKAVELPYGIHKVEVEASGYDTLTKHIQVGSEYATISFKLEESRKENVSNSNSLSENSTSRIPWEDTLDSIDVIDPDSISSNTLSSLSENALGTSSGYKVYIDSPKGVEVYLDGNYIGLSPVRFTKTAGRHEITLKKSGYKTKTYTIYLENDKQDETFSFSALEKESSLSSENEIPDKVIKAVSGLMDCELIYGIDIAIAGIATLQKTGIDKVETAIKSAVTDEVGETEASKYTFTVKDNLDSVTAPGDENGKGTVSITIYRSGYEKQIVNCDIVIVKPEEEPPIDSEKKYEVKITPNKVDVEKGGTVTFTAMVVEENEEPAENQEIKWAISEDHNSETKIDDSGLLYVSPEETAKELTVTATSQYSEVPGKAEVRVKQNEDVEVDNESGEKGDEGGDDLKDETEGDNNADGGESEKEDEVEPENNSLNDLIEETVTVNQNAHPIRKFFSSLFK